MKSDKNSDAELIQAYINGDKIALAHLVKRWHQLFCNKAYWMVRDKDVAKDIAQESWITIISNISKLKNREYFKYWAYRIVCNKSTDWLRAQSKIQRRTISNELQLEYKHEDYSEREAIKMALSAAINDLATNQQAVLKLFYIEAYSLKQISEILGVSVGTVKSRLFHARETLKAILKHRNYEN